MQRILIIGHPGAGKSTLARKLAGILDLPLIHLDQQFWQPGWRITPREEWRERVRELISGERWLMDGTYDNSLDIRLPRADTVIFLDFPRSICMWRIVKRVLSSYGKVRPDLAEGCPERWDWSFIKWTWRYRRDHGPRILRALRERAANVKVILLTSTDEVNRFIRELEV